MESLFAAADDFSEMLEETSKSSKHGTLGEIFNQDKSSEKQMEWEQNRLKKRGGKPKAKPKPKRHRSQGQKKRGEASKQKKKSSGKRKWFWATHAVQNHFELNFLFSVLWIYVERIVQKYMRNKIECETLACYFTRLKLVFRFLYQPQHAIVVLFFFSFFFYRLKRNAAINRHSFVDVWTLRKIESSRGWTNR